MRRAGVARFTTFSCALGLALAALAGPNAAVAVTGLVVALVGLSVATARRWTRLGQRLLVPCLLLTGLLSGFLLGTARVEGMAGGAMQRHLGETGRFELVVTGTVRASSGWQSATARVLRFDADRSTAGDTVWLEVPPEDDGADTSTSRASGSTGLRLRQGMIVSCTASVAAPVGPSASGFDQKSQLLQQGIEVVLTVRDVGWLTVVGRRGGVAGAFDRLREAAEQHLSLGPDAQIDEVLHGVVMGDTVGIDAAWLQAFRRSGIAHMLSVNGLHVASLAAIMMGLARLFRAPRRVGFALAASAAVFMVPFVGPSPSIIRAAVMIVVVLLGRWVGRGRDQWQVLALAAVVILTMNPYSLFDVGFQLSFAALSGIMTLTGPLEKLLRRLPRALASNVAVSLAAGVGTAPVALAQFGQTSLVSPLANVLVVPTLPLIVGLGMASVFAGFAWHGFSAALDTLASLPMMWTVLVARLMALAPVLSGADAGRTLVAAAGGAALLPAALALAGRPVRTPFDLPLPFFRRSLRWLRRRRPRRRRRALAWGAAVVTCGFVLGYAVYTLGAHSVQVLQTAVGGRSWPECVEVRVLDVGQGNAILVRTPEHHALLFDGGPKDCGLAGQLRSLGVHRLDVVVISHPHADHFAGLLQGIDGVQVSMFVDHVQVGAGASRAPPAGGGQSSSKAGSSRQAGETGGDEAGEYLRMRRILAARGCRYVFAATNDALAMDGVTVRFFAPAQPLALLEGADPWAARGGAPTGDELNGASLVSVLSVGSVDVLLPGDAEADALEGYGLPSAEIIVVPHHGSRGGVSTELLKRLGAEAAIISVGKDNAFGHPDPSTVSLLTQCIGTVLRTDTGGWVSCKVKGDQISITTERAPTR